MLRLCDDGPRVDGALRALAWALCLGGVACDAHGGAVDKLWGGSDAVQTIPRQRIQEFNVGNDLGGFAVLARGRQLYSVPVLGSIPDCRASHRPCSACLTHSVQRLWSPSPSEDVILAEGTATEQSTGNASQSIEVVSLLTSRARNRATVVWDGANVNAGAAPVLDLPQALAGAILGRDRSLFYYTHPYSYSTESSRTDAGPHQFVTLGHVVAGQARATEVTYAIDDLQVTAGGALVVSSEGGNVVRKLSADSALTVAACDQASMGACGIAVAGGASGCEFDAVGAGNQAQPPSFDGGTVDANAGSPPVPCSPAWGKVSISKKGCAAAMTQGQTGEGLVVSLSDVNAECTDFAPRHIPASTPTGQVSSDFRVVLSPQGHWAAVYSAGSSDSPVRIMTPEGDFLSTSVTRTQRVEFACSEDEGHCTLWAWHDGTQSPPGVSAISTTNVSEALRCPSLLPLRDPHFKAWSVTKASAVGADSFGGARLIRADVGARACSSLDLDFVPVCLGSLDSDRDFVCSPHRDGDVTVVTWGSTPATEHVDGFGLDNRLNAESCSQ